MNNLIEMLYNNNIDPYSLKNETEKMQVFTNKIVNLANELEASFKAYQHFLNVYNIDKNEQNRNNLMKSLQFYNAIWYKAQLTIDAKEKKSA